MPINYDKPGMKRPHTQSEYTKEEMLEYAKCMNSVTYFAENHVKIITPGMGKHQYSPYPFQTDFLKHISENTYTINLLSRQVGKALSLDTPILTTKGFSTMREIQVGDIVYGRDGKETKVTYISEVHTNRKVYEIAFSNQETIKADAEHLWKVSYTDIQSNKNLSDEEKELNLTTEEMLPYFERLQKRSKPTTLYTKITQPLEFESQELEIDPYLLGCWLGDGYSNDSRICCHVDDYMNYRVEFEKKGYEISDYKVDKRRPTTVRFTVYGLVTSIKKENLLNNKHIPEKYIFNSIENRLELIRGLMDTDGFAVKRNGTCQFNQSNEPMIDSFKFLLNTLGIKNRKTMKKTSHKDNFNITFVADDYDVFKLERKLKRQNQKLNHPKNKRLYIRSITEIESEPVKCIQVDNEDHMFLCGETLIPTHNTTVASIYMLWYAMFHDTLKIAILGNKQKTSKKILDDLKKMFLDLPDFLKPGQEKWDSLTVCFDNGSEIFAAATSADAIRGESLDLLVLDEFAFVANNIAEDFWTSNLPTLSTGGKLLIVSTPNGNTGKFYELYKTASENKSPDFDFKTFFANWRCVPNRDEKWGMRNKAALGPVKFSQEHECSFLGSSNTFIEGEVLETLKFIPPHYTNEDELQIWKDYNKKNIYVAGIDIARGVRRDFFIINIYDVTTFDKDGKYEQVAMYRNNEIDFFKFQDIAYKVLTTYGKPLAIWEENDVGLIFGQDLYYERGYEDVYMDLNTERVGVPAGKKNKAESVRLWKTDLKEGHMINHSEEMVTECYSFEELTPGTYGAKKSSSCNDDVIASSYWISYLLRSQSWKDYLSWIDRDANVSAFVGDTDMNNLDMEQHADILDMWNASMKFF